MKRIFQTLLTRSAVLLAIATPTFLLADAASAQPLLRGMDGNYIGAGIAAGVTEDESGDSSFGGNIQGRADIPLAPVSIRGAALIGEDGAALMPIVTYDVPIAPRTNLYLGGGYSFVTDEGSNTPLGDQSAPVLTAGAETAVTNNIVVYGDAKVGIDAYEDSNDAAVSLQLGAAFRF
ncbi:hypothetical protein [Vacuolonema iberomarrocanum]|uniref:hypothetical protein n=1 Tax=Vacuolonema iberomarrocanum TaxID=3454632 RepID=UPI0019DCA55C|nr:hypothetical protein [filamentous cyanobacterium LEGE 07170]